MYTQFRQIRNGNRIVFNSFFAKEYAKSFNIELKKGINAVEIIPKELREFWEPKYRSVLDGKTLEFEFMYPSGEENLYYRISLNPIIKDGKVSGISAISRDITNRKLAEEELNKRNKELETFNDVTVDREIRIIELKKEINELIEKAGEKPKYEIPV